MTQFKRHLAPLSDAAWDEIGSQARATLKANLTGRHLVTVKGPLGFDHQAVGLGRVKVLSGTGTGIRASVRQVLPIVELRHDFSLTLSEFDDLERGAKDIDLAPLIAAAKALACYEDRVIFHGLEAAQIDGMSGAAALDAHTLASEPRALMQDLASALERLRTDAVEGSLSDEFHLVVGPDLLRYITSNYIGSHPLRQEIGKMIGGGVHSSAAVEGGLLVRTDPDAFELTLAQDFTLGYHHHDSERVELFLLEALTFRVLDPAACLTLKIDLSMP